MKKTIALLAVTLLAGCATVKETYGETGAKAYALNCSGKARGWDKCFASTGDICKLKGFHIKLVNGEPYTVSFAQSSMNSSVSSTNRSMVITCK